MSWICLSINPHFLHYHGEGGLGDLFYEIFGSDYIEHYYIDCEDENSFESDQYVFVHCKDYKSHIVELRSHRYIKNALNSFGDISEISEEEIFEIKGSVPKIIHDGEYLVNRTGFFMFGDIVKVLKGSLSSINGVIIKRSKKNPDFYYVYFRLFVSRFYKRIHISNLEFDTSVFKFIKSPAIKGTLTQASKTIKKVTKEYEKLQKENKQKKLIKKTPKKTEKELESADVLDIAEILSFKG